MLRIDNIPQQVADDIQGLRLDLTVEIQSVIFDTI
jgi:hypothetical protein